MKFKQIPEEDKAGLYLTVIIHLAAVAGAGDVRVHRLPDALAFLEFRELLAEEIPVDGVGVVEVVGSFLLVGEVAGVFVVGILRDYHHLLVLEFLGDGLDHRGLAGT